MLRRLGPPVPSEVVAFTITLAGEWLPAASLAMTFKEYVVFGESPVIVAVVPVTEMARDVPWYTSYPVTPTLSVEACQDKVTLEDVTALTITFVGVVGAAVSLPPPPWTNCHNAGTLGGSHPGNEV